MRGRGSAATSVTACLVFGADFWGHGVLGGDCGDCTLFENGSTMCTPPSQTLHAEKQQPLPPSAILDPVIPWIMHWT